MDIKKELERLQGGILKTNKMILEIEAVGRQSMDDKEIYDIKKLNSLKAQQISIKDRIKLLNKIG